MTDPEREQLIEDLINIEPGKTKPARKGRVVRWASSASLVVAIVCTAVFAFAYIQLKDCTNQNFGDPSGLHQKAATATARYANVTDVFATAVVAAFGAQPSSDDAKARINTLKRDAHKWRDASKAWKTAVRAANTYQALHPLNRC